MVEDEENKDFESTIGESEFHDYDYVGHYICTAIVSFSKIKNRTADWVNLRNHCTLRNCICKNYNHCIGVNYGENLDGKPPEAVALLTKICFELMVK